MNALRSHIQRLATAAAILALLPWQGAPVAFASQGTAPVARAPQAAAPGDAGHSLYVWRDVDGNPLPFQSDEAIIDFLATADIEAIEGIELGVTNPRQVVLHRDGVRMRAALRDYDETFEGRRFAGEFYSRLRDSFTFDVPAYEMSRILGLDNVPPVTFRRLGDGFVSLQAWVEGAMMENDRIAEEIEPPSLFDFRKQGQNMRAFDTLIGNVDRNTGNILYDEHWNFWLIDHSRSFLRSDDTKYLDEIDGISRWLFERINALTLDDLAPLSEHLTDSEVEWILARRDKLVAHIEALIVERSEGAVLFEGRE